VSRVERAGASLALIPTFAISFVVGYVGSLLLAGW